MVVEGVADGDEGGVDDGEEGGEEQLLEEEFVVGHLFEL